MSTREKLIATALQKSSTADDSAWPLWKERAAAESAAIIAHIVLLIVSESKIRDHPDVLLLFIMSSITLVFHFFYLAGVWHWELDPLFSNMFAYGGNSRNTLKWLEYVAIRVFIEPHPSERASPPPKKA